VDLVARGELLFEVIAEGPYEVLGGHVGAHHDEIVFGGGFEGGGGNGLSPGEEQGRRPQAAEPLEGFGLTGSVEAAYVRDLGFADHLQPTGQKILHVPHQGHAGPVDVGSLQLRILIREVGQQFQSEGFAEGLEDPPHRNRPMDRHSLFSGFMMTNSPSSRRYITFTSPVSTLRKTKNGFWDSA
jgi:hypothetical protein